MRMPVRPVSPALRSRLEDRDRTAADPAVLGRGGREQQAQRHPLEDQQRDGELERGEHHQQGQQLALRRLRLPAAEQKIVPPFERSRPPRRPGEHREQRHQRPVKRDVVIGIADRRRDGDDLAAVDCSAFVIAALTLSWSASVIRITSCPPRRRRRTIRRRPDEAASAAESAAAPRGTAANDPPPPQPPREPRLSSLRPQSTTHGLIPPRTRPVATAATAAEERQHDESR